MWSKIKSWFSGFGSIFKKVAKTAYGEAVEMILPTVTTIVENLEKDSTLSGSQKLQNVSTAVKNQYGSVSDVAINLAVNVAIALIRGGMK